MVRLNEKQSSLGKDAAVVTPGFIPCGGIIDCVDLDSLGTGTSTNPVYAYKK